MIKRSTSIVSVLATLVCTVAPTAVQAADGEAPYGKSVQEKKAVNASMAEINTALNAAKKACGNSKLTASVDWKSYAAFEKQLLTDTDRTSHNVYGLVGDLVSEGLRGLKDACSDADYKKSAATLTSWVATPKYMKSASSSNAQIFTLKGSTMNVTFHPAMSTGGGAAALVRGAMQAAPSTEGAAWGKSVEEVKAVKDSMAEINTALAAAKSACGNKSLTVSVDWKAYGAFEDKLATETSRTKKNIYGLVGGLVSEGLSGLKDACGDADYKKAAAKLTQWSMTPKYVKDASSSNAQSYKKSGTTMTGTFHPAVSTGGGAGELVRKAL